MQTEILRDLSVFWGMGHVLLLFILLFRSRYTKKKTILLAGAGMGILMAVNAAGMLVYGIDALGRVFLFTCSIPSFFLLYFMSEHRRFRFLLTFCMADTMCLWIMAVTNLLDYYLGGGKYVLMFVSRLVIFPLLEYAIYRFLRKPYFELQNEVKKGWGIFAGMTMLYYVLLVAVVNYPSNIVNRPEDMPICILVLLLMFFNYATIFFCLYKQLQLYRKQQEERGLKEQKLSLEMQLDNQQRIRKMKHDMKGYTAVLSELLAAGKTEEALEYLERVKTEMDTLLGSFCANPYLNAVFTYFAQKFKELHAEYRTDILIGEEELPYMELCQILSNGLENACDALRELPEEMRKISVQMRYSRDYLVIRMKNRCREGVFVEKGTIPSTEKKEAGHGFGLFTIQQAARRLEGDMSCYTKDGTFVLDVLVRV